VKTLLVEASLTGFSRIKDGSVKFSFKSMREMSNDEFSLVDKYYQQPGWLAFKMDEVSIDDIPAEGTDMKGRYSPSQLLRNKIFALHMKKGGTKEDFTPYYTRIMAGLEESVQSKLDALED
jgi:hypothetical protein